MEAEPRTPGVGGLVANLAISVALRMAPNQVLPFKPNSIIVGLNNDGPKQDHQECRVQWLASPLFTYTVRGNSDFLRKLKTYMIAKMNLKKKKINDKKKIAGML